MKRGSKKQKQASTSASQRASSMTTDEKQRYTDFLGRNHPSTRFYSEADMREIHVHDVIHGLFSASGLQGFLTIQEDTCPALTSEFLATLVVDSNTGGIQFLMGGQRRRFSLTDVNSAFNLPTDNEILKAKKDVVNRMWYKMTGDDSFPGKDAYVRSIYHPVFRIAQKFLGSTVYARLETSKMREGEVMCLYYMTHGQTFDLGYEIVRKLKSVANSIKGDICVGGLIKRFATVLDVDIGDRETSPYRLVDIDHLQRGKVIVKPIDRGLRTILPDSRSVTFRGSALDITDRRTWYHLPAGHALPRLDGDSEEEEAVEEDSEDEDDDEAADDEDGPAEAGDGQSSGQAARMEVDAPAPASTSERRSKRRQDRSTPPPHSSSWAQQMDALSAQMGDLLQYHRSIDSHLASMDGHYTDMSTQISGIRTHLAGIDERYAGLDTRLSDMSAHQSSIDAQVQRLHFHSYGYYWDPSAPPLPPPPPPQ